MIESDWDLLCNITDELMATGRYPGRHEAMKEPSGATRTWTRPRPA
ncbi:MAG: hypothetical protein ACM3UP_02585 [Methanocella sp.]